MRVFVTGASGFIGSAVVVELIGAGHHVVGLARSPGSAARLSALGAEVVEASLTDLDGLHTAAASSDGVIHLAFRHGNPSDQAVGTDRAAIETLGAALAGSDRPLVVTSGTLVLPAGRYAVAHVLGAAHNGNVDTTATVVYDDGSTAAVPLRLSDWAGGPAFGNARAISMAYRIRAGKGQDGPSVSIFGTTLALDPGKQVRWIVLPTDPRVEVYAVTLEAAPQ